MLDRTFRWPHAVKLSQWLNNPSGLSVFIFYCHVITLWSHSGENVITNLRHDHSQRMWSHHDARWSWILAWSQVWSHDFLWSQFDQKIFLLGKAMAKIRLWSDHIIRHFWYCSNVCKESENTSDEEALKILKVGEIKNGYRIHLCIMRTFLPKFIVRNLHCA